MTVKDYRDGKVITLSKAFDNRAKVLNIVYFIVFSFSSLAIFSMAIPAIDRGIGLTMLVLGLTVVYLIASYRFINKAFKTEKLFVDKSHLKVSKRGFLSKKETAYELGFISNLRHLEKQKAASHPLATQSFDYLGLETQQKVINELHGDDRIAFDYRGRTARFGENIYSWDFEKLALLLHDLTGYDLERNKQVEEPSAFPNEKAEE